MHSQIQQSQQAAQRYLELQQNARGDELTALSMYGSVNDPDKQHLLEQLQRQAYERQQQLLSLCFERIYEAADFQGTSNAPAEDDRVIRQQREYIQQLESELRRSVESQSCEAFPVVKQPKMVNSAVQTDVVEVADFSQTGLEQQVEELQRINRDQKEELARSKQAPEKLKIVQKEYKQFKQQAEEEVGSYVQQLQAFQERNRQLQEQLDQEHGDPMTDSRVQLQLDHESQSVHIKKLNEEVQQKNRTILDLGTQNAKLNQQLGQLREDNTRLNDNLASAMRNRQTMDDFFARMQESELPTVHDLNQISQEFKIPKSILQHQLTLAKQLMRSPQFRDILPLHTVPSPTCELAILRYLQNNLPRVSTSLTRTGELVPPMFSCDSKLVAGGDALNFVIFSVLFRGEVDEIKYFE